MIPAEKHRAKLVARRRAIGRIVLAGGIEHTRSRSPFLAITMEHPLGSLLGRVPDDVAALLAKRGEQVVRFDAFRQDVATQPLFEPFDANVFPLRGFEAIERPGPTITVWRVRNDPEPPAGAP